MQRFMVGGLFALIISAFGITAAHADAETLDVVPDTPSLSVEMALELGILDRGTTGIGAPLLGYGYDHGGGPTAGGRLRLLVPVDDRYFHHGLEVGFQHQAGGTLGLSDEVGFYFTEVTAGYAFRTMFPCMSNELDERVVRFTGTVGIAVANLDAGTGRAPSDEHWNERVRASDQFDHMALGPHVGVALDYHLGDFLIGAAVDARQLFGESRSFVTSATLRTGVDLDL